MSPHAWALATFAQVYPDFLSRYKGAYNLQMAHFVAATRNRRALGAEGAGGAAPATLSAPLPPCEGIAAATLDDCVASLQLAMACEEQSAAYGGRGRAW